MPKTPSRTSKKKKFNSRFPPARIKKIMQLDEDVGKVAAAVPVIISRALELFIESLISETSETTIAKNAKTMSTSHIKQTIHSNKQFDFLRDLVANVADHTPDESTNDTGNTNGDVQQKRPRGRPRKMKEPAAGTNKRGESSKTSADTSGEEEDEEENEETESDNEDEDDDDARGSSTKPAKQQMKEKNSVCVSVPPTSSLPQHAAYTPHPAQLYSGPSPANLAATQNVPAGYNVPQVAGFSSHLGQQYLPPLPHHFGLGPVVQPASAAATLPPLPHKYPALYPGLEPSASTHPSIAVPPYQLSQAQVQPINLSMSAQAHQHQYNS